MAHSDFDHYTTDELSELHDVIVSGIRDLVRGAAAVKFVLDGDEVSYSRADLPQVRRLLADVSAALTVRQAGSGAVFAFVVSGSKGL